MANRKEEKSLQELDFLYDSCRKTYTYLIMNNS